MAKFFMSYTINELGMLQITFSMPRDLLAKLLAGELLPAGAH